MVNVSPAVRGTIKADDRLFTNTTGVTIEAAIGAPFCNTLEDNSSTSNTTAITAEIYSKQCCILKIHDCKGHFMILLGNAKTGAGKARDGGCQIETSRDLCREYQKQSGSCGDGNAQPGGDTAADITDSN